MLPGFGAIGPRSPRCWPLTRLPSSIRNTLHRVADRTGSGTLGWDGRPRDDDVGLLASR